MGRPKKPTSGIQYDSCTRVYHFIGERLSLPAPGTYDASAWTPPTRRLYDVHMQGDGLWWLERNGVKVDSGDGRVPNRSNARKIIMNYRAKCGLPIEQEASDGPQDQTKSEA